MQTYRAIFDRAAKRHGGAAALAAKLAESQPKSPAELAAIPDDRWLAEITRCVFQAGFNWSVIENKWDGFETAFDGFDVSRQEAEEMILAAHIILGWIKPEDLMEATVDEDDDSTDSGEGPDADEGIVPLPDAPAAPAVTSE